MAAVPPHFWVQLAGDTPVEVSTSGCRNVGAFVEAIKAKLPSALGQFDVNRIQLHTQEDAPPLDPRLKLVDLVEQLDTPADWDDVTLVVTTQTVTPLSTQTGTPPQENSHELYRAALMDTFQDPSSALDRLWETIVGNANLWKSSEHLSPYVSIVKPSGSGKTRMAMELGRQCMFTFYICLRNQQSTGIPRPSYVSRHLASSVFDTNEKAAESKCGHFLVQCLYKLAQFLNERVALKEKRKSEGRMGSSEQCLEEEKEDIYRAWFDQQMKEDAEGKYIGESFWEEVCKQQCSVKSATAVIENIRTAMHDLGLPVQPVLFVLDEARILVKSFGQFDQFVERYAMNNFRILRRSLGNVQRLWEPGATEIASESSKQETNPYPATLFALFMDTNSLIWIFSPSKRIDASARLKLEGDALFPPIWLLDTWDVFAEYDTPTVSSFVTFGQQENNSQLKSNSAKEFLRALFRKGRPLWKKPLDELTLDACVGVAQAKLVCDQSARRLVSLDQEQSLAVLTCRLALFVDPASVATSDLLASYMADCAGISSDRERIFVGYPLEPILAEAAAYFATKFRTPLLHRLCEMVKSGMVGRAYRGELLGRYLLLDAWQRASQSRGRIFGMDTCFSVPMTVRSFLQHFSPGVLDAMKGQISENDRERFLNGVVCFNQFVRVQFSLPSFSDLKPYLQRCAALLLKENEVAFDIVIPVCLKDGQMSAILYQTRNYSSTDGKIAKAYLAQNHSALFKIPPTVPYLAIYSQFGDDVVPSAVMAGVDNGVPVVDLKKSRRTTRAEGSKATAEEEFQMIVGLCGLHRSVYGGIDDDKDWLGLLVTLRDATMNTKNFCKSDEEKLVHERNFVLTYNATNLMEMQGRPRIPLEAETEGNQVDTEAQAGGSEVDTIGGETGYERPLKKMKKLEHGREEELDLMDTDNPSSDSDTSALVSDPA